RAIVQEERAGVRRDVLRVHREELGLGEVLRYLALLLGAPEEVVRLDEQRLVRLEVNGDAGRQLPVEVGVLRLRDHLPLIVVEGERAVVIGPLGRARKRPGQNDVVATRPPHAHLHLLYLHPVLRSLLVEAEELSLAGLDLARAGREYHRLQLGRLDGEGRGAHAERENGSEKSRGTHGSMSFPFLERRRVRRAGGDPATDRV